MSKMLNARLGKLPQLFKSEEEKEDVYDIFPACNLREDSLCYLFEIAVPGFTKEDISLSVADQYLVVEGERLMANEQGYIQHEFNNRSFKRIVKLGDDIDIYGITAKVSLGIVEIILPKKR